MDKSKLHLFCSSFLFSSKGLAVIDLESPYDKVCFEKIDAPEPSILQCHPNDGSQLALVVRVFILIYTRYDND